jgi:hypothetical protein
MQAHETPPAKWGGSLTDIFRANRLVPKTPGCEGAARTVRQGWLLVAALAFLAVWAHCAVTAQAAESHSHVGVSSNVSKAAAHADMDAAGHRA